MKVGELPIWVNQYVERMVSAKLIANKPDQLIVNEYMPGQGIANHIDCEPCFGDTIISLSLGSKVIMNLTNRSTKEVVPIILEPRSALLLRGASRYDWMHGIIGRKTDRINDVKWKRTRRISLTFRKVILREE